MSVDDDNKIEPLAILIGNRESGTWRAAEWSLAERIIAAGWVSPEEVAELADSFEDSIDWSDGRSNYGDNEAYAACARDLRALMPKVQDEQTRIADGDDEPPALEAS